MLVFDMGQAVVTTLAGNFLPPGTKLEGTKVHGGLIVAGLFSLISSLAGFWAVCRRSLRAASLFFISTTLGAVIGLALLVTTWMTGSIGISTVLANAPGIVLMVYLCVVTNSFRMGLKQSAAGIPALPPVAPGYDEELDIAEISAAGGSGGAVAAAAMGAAARGGASGGAGNKYRDASVSLGSHEDEFTVNARDIELGPDAAGQGGGGRAAASAASLDEEDDDDNDLGRPNARRV